MAEAKRAYKLIKVEADANNNKFYTITELGPDQWEFHWGRVGNTGEKLTTKNKDGSGGPITETMAMKQLKAKTNPKKSGGPYTDQTHLFAEAKVDSGQGWQIGNAEVRKFVETLQTFAGKAVSTNYLVTSDQVTQAQIEEAQAIVDELVPFVKMHGDIKALNDHLLKLYRVIPRKMKKVADTLVKEDITNKAALDTAKLKLQEEQDLLDVMAGQVTLSGQQKTHTKGLSLLDVGITIEPASDKDIDIIKKMLKSESAGHFRRAWVISNVKTQKALDEQVERATNKYTELLWHGSRNENWWSIATSGLRIRPAGAVYTGSMYGDGIYGANRARKSIGYTSLSGSHWARGSASKAFLGIYNFHLGNMLKAQTHEHWHSSLTFDKLRAKGSYNSFYAVAGTSLYNDEFIVYKENQTTIKYLVEIG